MTFFNLTTSWRMLKHYFGILSDISDILSNTISGISSDILSGIASDIHSGILSDILADYPF